MPYFVLFVWFTCNVFPLFAQDDTALQRKIAFEEMTADCPSFRKFQVLKSTKGQNVKVCDTMKLINVDEHDSAISLNYKLLRSNTDTFQINELIISKYGLKEPWEIITIGERDDLYLSHRTTIFIYYCGRLHAIRKTIFMPTFSPNYQRNYYFFENDQVVATIQSAPRIKDIINEEGALEKAKIFLSQAVQLYAEYRKMLIVNCY